MFPDVLARKLAKLHVFLSDLRPYEGASISAVEADHYRVERLLQLLVEVATDILAHELANLGVVPASYSKWPKARAWTAPGPGEDRGLRAFGTTARLTPGVERGRKTMRPPTS